MKSDHPSCVTLYGDKGFRYEPSVGAMEKDGIDTMVDDFRAKL